jgi:hypothetical protein
LEDTLFTFCPPGPDARIAVHDMDAGGRTTAEETGRGSMGKKASVQTANLRAGHAWKGLPRRRNEARKENDR